MNNGFINPTAHDINSLVAYFVVFFKAGFTPGDLRRAQKDGR